MTLLCLFVVLAALFITVFNSRTAKQISTTDSVLAFPNSAPSAHSAVKPEPSASQPEPTEVFAP